MQSLSCTTMPLQAAVLKLLNMSLNYSQEQFMDCKQGDMLLRRCSTSLMSQTLQ